jgi:hypothetical protein
VIRLPVSKTGKTGKKNQQGPPYFAENFLHKAGY